MRQPDKIKSKSGNSFPKVLTPISHGAVLVIAPHPDDETLGCGGTLALLRKLDCRVKIVFVTDGAGAGTLQADASAIRRKEAVAALSVLGIDDTEFFEEPDGNFQNSTRFKIKVRDLLIRFQPDWLFIPSVFDYHHDHIEIGRAVLSLWQNWRAPSRAFIYEVWCPLPATHVIDISRVIDIKKQAIRCYVLPLAHCNYLSASIGLASFRALCLPSGQGGGYAEAFTEVKKENFFQGVLQSISKFWFDTATVLNRQR